MTKGYICPAKLGCTRVKPTPESIRLILFKIRYLAHLSDAQRLALDNLFALIGAEQLSLVVGQGSDVLNTRLDAFLNPKDTLIGQVHDYVASAMPSMYK